MQLISNGVVKNQIEQKFYHYNIRVLEIAELPLILALQEEVISAMDRRDYCVPLSAEEYLEILQGSGEALGLFIGESLYAICAILYPGEREDNMARELNFSDDQLHSVAQLEIALVHPSFQGNCLQHKMAALLVERAKCNNRCDYLFTTVSPYNYPSLRTVTSLGLHIAKVCKKYFAWDRYVAYRDFLQPHELDIANAISLSNTAFEEQQELLARSYLGFSQFKSQKDIKVLFAKRKERRR